jgi:hypothetical protein
VRTILDRFKNGSWIDTQTDTHQTIITICNYDASIISDTSRSVKERLAGLDPLGDRWNEQHHGRAN